MAEETYCYFHHGLCSTAGKHMKPLF